ncbi:MAG: YjjG family noncanonical pyrimidine nucleotidase [Oscillospiraceae bacterium]
MAANYNCLLFDLDGTLLDFAVAEREAVEKTLQKFSLPSGPETVELFSSINASLWAALERGEIKKDKLAVQRFTQLLQQLGAEGDAIKMNNEYLTNLSAVAIPMPGAEEMLAELAEFATLAVVSNGVQRVQLSRLKKSGLLPYFDEVFVSEKLGVTKPSPRFFDLSLKALGIANRGKVLVIGDSLTADIQGGINAKLATCWCNYANAENTTAIKPTYTVRDFSQIKLYAVGEEELKRAENREKRHLV